MLLVIQSRCSSRSSSICGTGWPNWEVLSRQALLKSATSSLLKRHVSKPGVVSHDFCHGWLLRVQKPALFMWNPLRNWYTTRLAMMLPFILYFDFHLQHPGLSPVIQILFFSFKLVGIGVIDQVSKCMLPLQIKVRQAVSPIQRPELWVVQGRSGPLIKVLHWQASLKAIIVKCVKYEKQFANLLCSLYTLHC